MARSPLLLLAVLAVPLALWVQTPGNLGKIKGVLKPGLSLLPFWLGDGSALTDKHVDLLNGPSFGADGCEVKFEGAPSGKSGQTGDTVMS